jgi:hypothetical protein
MVRSVYVCIGLLSGEMCAHVCVCVTSALVDLRSLSFLPFWAILKISTGKSIDCAVNRLNDYALLAISM